MFDYPPEVEVKTEEAPEKVKTAVLSTTAQAKRRKLAKDKQNRHESMDIDATPPTPKPDADDKMDTDENVVETGKTDEDKDGEKEGSKKKVEKEKVGYDVENMSRVLPAQIKYISFAQDGRYQPVKKPTGGVILLNDTRPHEEKTLMELKAKKKTTSSAAAPGSGSGAEGRTVDTAMRDALSAALGGGAGAAAAAGVLNAVDEDDEDGEEAPCPDEFEVDEDEAEGEGE